MLLFLCIKNVQKLAIKKMTLQCTKEFLAELQVLTNVHHTNLVSDSLSVILTFCMNDMLQWGHI